MFSYGLWDTLGARGFSCAVSGFGHVLQNDPREKLRRSCLRPLADETKLSVAREKKTSCTQGTYGREWGLFNRWITCDVTKKYDGKSHFFPWFGILTIKILALAISWYQGKKSNI